MKKVQQQPAGLESKVIELVKPRTFENLLPANSNEVEFLCDGNDSCTLSSNTGVQQDDLLF